LYFVPGEQDVNGLPPALVFITLGLFVLCLVVLPVWRSRVLLRRWAERNGFEIVEKQFRYFRQGPFFWTASGRQIVYRILVADRSAGRRKGWARCGSWWLGVLADRVDVRWDE
jgi:hypothetical protein